MGNRVAIIGCGPTTLFLLQHVSMCIEQLQQDIDSIVLFDQQQGFGFGMPYSPQTTDRYNICNISSEELPKLPCSFADWLRTAPSHALAKYGIEPESISESETYSRLAMGDYFSDQIDVLTETLRSAGVAVERYTNTRVIDLRDTPSTQTVTVLTASGNRFYVDRAVIATGHSWENKDEAENGYFASPWPIRKLLPKSGVFFNFKIGIHGASLSAFDVLASLAHRHGDFVSKQSNASKGFVFVPSKGAEEFRLVMHSTNGWLPHLQYEQVSPIRQVYRHVDRQTLLNVCKSDGTLQLDDFFSKICRPCLLDAFNADDRPDMAARLSDEAYTLSQFIDQMEREHKYDDAFEGMKAEMPEAVRSVTGDKPIHWKEVIDDLMYMLNFHAPLLSAEDHIYFQSEVLPFLMNVIAAMPLDSARKLLAMRDAGKLELIAGHAEVKSIAADGICVEVTRGENVEAHRYKMFIDSTGQKGIRFDDFPFPTLIAEKTVCEASVPFSKQDSVRALPDELRLRVKWIDHIPYYLVGGIDIDGNYRIVDGTGRPNDRIYDVAFPHAAGLRPYSYGLQCCNLTSMLVVEHWLSRLRDGDSLQSETDVIPKSLEQEAF
jgi:hypothetical protein